jgi:hypothetical protein
MRVPGGLTAHVVRMPSAKDVIEYRRGFARVLDLTYNRQELTINLRAGGLYHRAALKLGVGVSLAEIAADEFYTMMLIEEERDRLDRERAARM